jgi:hypothetical protein
MLTSMKIADHNARLSHGRTVWSGVDRTIPVRTHVDGKTELVRPTHSSKDLAKICPGYAGQLGEYDDWRSRVIAKNPDHMPLSARRLAGIINEIPPVDPSTPDANMKLAREIYAQVESELDDHDRRSNRKLRDRERGRKLKIARDSAIMLLTGVSIDDSDVAQLVMENGWEYLGYLTRVKEERDAKALVDGGDAWANPSVILGPGTGYVLSDITRGMRDDPSRTVTVELGRMASEVKGNKNALTRNIRTLVLILHVAASDAGARIPLLESMMDGLEGMTNSTFVSRYERGTSTGLFTATGEPITMFS